MVGENGAGKSTLIRCLAGVLAPSDGRIERAGATRVAWVEQEPLLPGDLSAREWIFLGDEWSSRWRVLRKRAMDAAAQVALQQVGADLPPARRLATLTAPQRKQVQLARAFRQAPDVLLLDEPTAVLGARETNALFAAIRLLRQGGGAVLYVSHRLDEVSAIAERVTVLRDGQRVAVATVSAINTSTLVEQMVGRAIPPRARDHRQLGDSVLDVRGLMVAQVRDFCVTVAGGEIVGLAGLLGAGRSEAIEAIAGIAKPEAGQITHAPPLAFVPEDRGRKGLVAQLDVRSNIFLPAAAWRLRHADERRQAAGWIERLRIRGAAADAPITSLSGGNQQKVLLARALRQAPRLLLLDEPTAGIDVGAKAEIHQLIVELAQQGAGILLASSDMPELLSLCDRIVALRGGRAVATFDAAETNEAALAASITGAA